MASTYSDLKLELIGTGDQSGTWGSTTNINLGTALQEAITGYGNPDYTTDANLTLGYTDTNAAQVFRNLVLNVTSTVSLSATRELIIPAIAKQYYIWNNTTGGQTITVKTAVGSGVDVPNGKKMVVFSDGTDVFEPINNFDSLSLSNPLGVSEGGTGNNTLTAGGILKGAGTSAIAIATVGTDYVAPGTATTFTAKQTFNGSTSVLAAALKNIVEPATVSATAATGTIQFDVTTQSVLYYTTNASTNWTVNFRASSGTSLNTAMAVGDVITVAFLVTNGSPAYYNNEVRVDNSIVTPKWQGGTAPTSGNASSIDVYTYTIVKTAGATFTVFASQTRFA
jgi:hypothetical protein